MKWPVPLSILALIGFWWSQAAAQTPDLTQRTTDLIRLCAPSENLRVKIEGKVGGFIARKLAGAEAGGEAEVFRDGELLGKLVEASPEDATEIYGMYLECIKPGVDRLLSDLHSSYHPGYDEPTEMEMRAAIETEMLARGAKRKGDGFAVENPLNGMRMEIQDFKKESCRVASRGGGYECTYIVQTSFAAFSNESSQAGQDHARAVNQLLSWFAGGTTTSREVVIRRFVKLDHTWMVSAQ